MVSFTTVSTLLALALGATAAPATSPASPLVARSNSGDATYFDDGLGACGWWSNPGDAIVAVSAGLFDQNRNGGNPPSTVCGRHLNIHYNGQNFDATVVDRCEGCAWGDLDLSKGLFTEVFGSLGPGRVQITWDWA